MDPHTTLQDNVETVVRQATRPLPRHALGERLRHAGCNANPNLVQGALARLIARGRIADTQAGLVATPLRQTILVRAR